MRVIFKRIFLIVVVCLPAVGLYADSDRLDYRTLRRMGKVEVKNPVKKDAEYGMMEKVMRGQADASHKTQVSSGVVASKANKFQTVKPPYFNTVYPGEVQVSPSVEIYFFRVRRTYNFKGERTNIEHKPGEEPYRLVSGRWEAMMLKRSYFKIDEIPDLGIIPTKTLSTE